jgi:hypothetical protein
VVFRYDVELTDLAKDKSLTMGAADDGKKGLLKDICYDLVSTYIRKNNNGVRFYGHFASSKMKEFKVLFVYDNRKNLFTNKHMDSKVQLSPSKLSTNNQIKNPHSWSRFRRRR